MSITIRFTGRHLHAFDEKIDVTCAVRNELNGEREANQVVQTMGSTLPNGLDYMPRPFPPGRWQITGISDEEVTTEYWPVFIATNAWQELPVWEIEHGLYKRATSETFIARGYGIHHARWFNGEQLVPSRTTLGCGNVLAPEDARWLARDIRVMTGARERVFIEVPEWADWEV